MLKIVNVQRDRTSTLLTKDIRRRMENIIIRRKSIKTNKLKFLKKAKGGNLSTKVIGQGRQLH
jgi:hypothetical protein